jgi:hypothetical protein
MGPIPDSVPAPKMIRAAVANSNRIVFRVNVSINNQHQRILDPGSAWRKWISFRACGHSELRDEARGI